MDSQRQQASDRIKQANNILVTVSSNPSVDQLAACIALTVSLNKMGKHATAVFSGEVPSTLEFLQPEKTIEKNTDSLRDFIIALDKSKADKLRYKVEDRVVKIFITPYRTSITGKDLEFSQGDFNVDVVLALGVHKQEELDLAITSHGRILHDATIVTLNTKAGGELGSINWLDPNASSLSELGVQLVNTLDKSLVDTQVATAFLTGIVAETERFSNSKTTPQTMSISAQLMSSGANQQLVATKLEEPVAPPPPQSAPIATQNGETHDEPKPVKKSEDGTLEIAHDETKTAQEEKVVEDREEAVKRAHEAVEKAEDAGAAKPKEFAPPVQETPFTPPEPEPAPAPPPPQIHIDEHGSLSPVDDEDFLPPAKPHTPPEISHHNEAPKMVLEPPTLGGALTANSTPPSFDGSDAAGLPGMPTEEGSKPDSMDEDRPSIAPTIMPSSGSGDDRNAPGTSFLGDQPLVEPEHPSFSEEAGKTLSDIERDVHSSHVEQADAASASDASGDAGNRPAQPSQPVQLSQPAAGFEPPPPAPTAAPVNDPIVSAFHPDNSAILPPVSTDQPVSGPAPGIPVVPPTADDSTTSVAPDLPAADSTSGSAPSADVDSARDAVAQAMNSASANQPLEPIQALNAQPITLPAGSDDDSSQFQPVTADPAVPAQTSAPVDAPPVQPWNTVPAASPPQYGVPSALPFNPTGTPAASNDPNAPPTVPPPMMPMPPTP